MLARDDGHDDPPATRKRARHGDNSQSSSHADFVDDTPRPLDSEIPPAPDSPPQASYSFSGRRRKAPRILKDYVPHSLLGLASHLHPVPPRPPLAPSRAPSPLENVVLEPELVHDTVFRTDTDLFGLYREYTQQPVIYPVNDAMTWPAPKTQDSLESERGAQSIVTDSNFFRPFLNPTEFRLMNWFYGCANTKSESDLDRLIKDVGSAEDFSMDDFLKFNSHRVLSRLDEYASTSAAFSADDGWKEGSVTIHLPNVKSKYVSETAAPGFKVSGIHYRPFLEVIKGAFQSQDARRYHFLPFKLFQKTPREHVRVYTDVYNSDAMLEEDAKIRALPQDPSDDPETELAIASILLWSDSTHLASFGTASLWPIYMFLGNLSKYTRGKPSAFAGQHLAYVPTVSLADAMTYNRFLYFFSYPTRSRTNISTFMGSLQRTPFYAF